MNLLLRKWVIKMSHKNMIVKDLKGYIFDKIIIYTEVNGDYINIYDGYMSDVPNNILICKVENIGINSKEKCVDIKVLEA